MNKIFLLIFATLICHKAGAVGHQNSLPFFENQENILENDNNFSEIPVDQDEDQDIGVTDKPKKLEDQVDKSDKIAKGIPVDSHVSFHGTATNANTLYLQETYNVSEANDIFELKAFESEDFILPSEDFIPRIRKQSSLLRENLLHLEIRSSASQETDLTHKEKSIHAQEIFKDINDTSSNFEAIATGNQENFAYQHYKNDKKQSKKKQRSNNLVLDQDQVESQIQAQASEDKIPLAKEFIKKTLKDKYNDFPYTLGSKKYQLIGLGCLVANDYSHYNEQIGTIRAFILLDLLQKFLLEGSCLKQTFLKEDHGTAIHVDEYDDEYPVSRKNVFFRSGERFAFKSTKKGSSLKNTDKEEIYFASIIGHYKEKVRPAFADISEGDNRNSRDLKKSEEKKMIKEFFDCEAFKPYKNKNVIEIFDMFFSKESQIKKMPQEANLVPKKNSRKKEDFPSKRRK